MNEPMKEICVVHLVRAHNGIEPFRHFLESYRENPGGIKHDLLIVFKGFGQPQDTAEYRKLLVPFVHTTLDVSDEGFDITAYFAAVNRYSEQYRYFCFLNSHSVVLDYDWLKKLYINVSTPGIGLVGATGSWGSHRTNAYAWFLEMVAVFPSQPKNKNRTNTEISYIANKAIFNWKKTIYRVKRVGTLLQFMFLFDPFPNYHIRTNAFMISGARMMSLECPRMKTKMDTYRFESGKKSLTKQILEYGERVIVVGKDGVGYEKESWPKSRTFWQSEQENLLVDDNLTLDYKLGDIERRKYLSSVAWGK